MVEVKTFCGVVTYTEEEIQKILEDFAFLKDAFLVLLNSKVTDASDIPYTKEDVIKYAKEIYDNSEYSRGFIDECFSNHLK